MISDGSLNDIDKKILTLLQGNSRITVAEISRNIDGLAESTIRYRIDKLESEGYIKKYTILLNQKKFGKHLTVMFSLKVLPSNIQKALNYLKKMDCITEVHHTTGTYSVVAFGLFKNNKELTEFITEKLKNVPMVDYDVGQVLKKEKDEFFWS